jgi:hypothetical protein
LKRFAWPLIQREDDPSRVDWAALLCLVLYLSLAMLVIAVMCLSFVWFDITSLRGP